MSLPIFVTIKASLMLLSHLGDFDCDSTANYALFSFLSLRAVSAHSQLVLSAFAVSLSAFAMESPTRKKFPTCSKLFSIRSAVCVESYSSLRGLAVHSPSNWRRLRCEPTETTGRLWRMHGNCAANHITSSFFIARFSVRVAGAVAQD